MPDIEWVYLPLSQGRFAKIDTEDFDRVGLYRWSVNQPSPGRFYAHRLGPDGKHVYLHRAVLNAGPDTMVDHRDGDGLDCRKKNLRLATPRQNACNTPNRKPGASGFRGVVARANGRFQVRVKVNGRYIEVGYFRDPVLGALAYDEKAAELHGEFAVLNFPLAGAAR